MISNASVLVEGQLLGEYVDVAEIPEALTSLRSKPASGDCVVRPSVIGSYVDVWSRSAANREFTVLLHDKRVISVRGHALKYVPNASNPSDQGSYGVVVREGESETFVALFPVSDVSGVFSGDIRLTRESA